MDSNRHKDSGEMYSSDEQGDYTPLDGAPRFSVQGLSDALADVREGITEPPAEEYAMILEVTMANRPGWLCPLTFSWNVGMVMHVLKNDPVLRELEHVQVDGPGTAYLFGSGYCVCNPGSHGGGFFRVDLAVSPLCH